jgi:hypothetical protein
VAKMLRVWERKEKKEKGQRKEEKGQFFTL